MCPSRSFSLSVASALSPSLSQSWVCIQGVVPVNFCLLNDEPRQKKKAFGIRFNIEAKTVVRKLPCATAYQIEGSTALSKMAERHATRRRASLQVVQSLVAAQNDCVVPEQQPYCVGPTRTGRGGHLTSSETQVPKGRGRALARL